MLNKRRKSSDREQQGSGRTISTWFIRLRWIAFLSQAGVLFCAVQLFELTLPWKTIALLLLLIPISNGMISLASVKKFDERTRIGSLLVFDTIILSAILYCAGGPTNPFSIVYLLHVVLAAVMLGTGWTWFLAALSSSCFAMLFLSFIPVPQWDHHGMHHGFSIHLHGMFIAYVVVAFLVTYFLGKIVSELREKERRLERLEGIAASQQRLTSLITLTAGAAHELGTPLGTIAIVGHELERTLTTRCPDPQIIEDLHLLQEETARCKGILRSLAERTGDVLGEAPQEVPLLRLLEQSIEPFSNQSSPIKVEVVPNDFPVRIPQRACVLALRALIKNAIDATDGDPESVAIRAESDAHHFTVNVIDSGCGIHPENLERIGEPFFSTKGVEKGMGLGVYLARLTAEQLGGSLKFFSSYGEGTTACFSLPCRGAGL